MNNTNPTAATTPKKSLIWPNRSPSSCGALGELLKAGSDAAATGAERGLDSPLRPSSSATGRCSANWLPKGAFDCPGRVFFGKGTISAARQGSAVVEPDRSVPRDLRARRDGPRRRIEARSAGGSRIRRLRLRPSGLGHGKLTSLASHDRIKEPLHTSAITAGGVTVSRTPQYAGQFAAAVENRTARVSLAGCGRQFDHLDRGSCTPGATYCVQRPLVARYLPEP